MADLSVLNQFIASQQTPNPVALASAQIAQALQMPGQVPQLLRAKAQQLTEMADLIEKAEKPAAPKE